MSSTPIFHDTHAHLDFPDFDSDRSQVMERARAAGIQGVLCVGTDFESSRRALDICLEYEDVRAVVGWHPNHVMEAGRNGAVSRRNARLVEGRGRLYSLPAF